MQYTLVKHEDQQYLTAFVPGRSPLMADDNHPNWDKLVAGVLADDESVVDLFVPIEAAAKHFEYLSERVTVANDRIYLDGDEVDNALTQQVLRFLNEGVEDWAPLVAFFEKVQTNPQPESREQLYGFIQRHEITLTEDGDIVFYKGVKESSQDGYDYESQSAGKAIVDGEIKTGCIPQNIGSTVEMPRSVVKHDPHAACHTGLHAATYGFAKGFGNSAVLEIHVNPRDVVSVPYHADKIRCCRYVVIDVATTPHKAAVVLPTEEEAIILEDWEPPTTPTEEDEHEERLDAPEGTYGEPEAVNLETLGLSAEEPAEDSHDEFVAVYDSLTPADDEADEDEEVELRTPSQQAFEEMVALAKKQRKGIKAVAPTRGWILVGDSPKDIGSWRVPSRF